MTGGAPHALTALEETVGYRFADRRLLETALTHTSFANEHRGQSDNQRLEFLGDSVLGCLVAEMLYKRFPRESEGSLTRRRAGLVCEASLAEAARKLELSRYLRMGQGERRHGEERPSTLADAFEALLAAMYLDGGPAAPAALVRRMLGEDPPSAVTDYKSAYQELVQRDGSPTPTYRLLATEGPEHEMIFTCAVLVGDEIRGTGSGRSRKQAEQQAAKMAMDHER